MLLHSSDGECCVGRDGGCGQIEGVGSVVMAKLDHFRDKSSVFCIILHASVNKENKKSTIFKYLYKC